MLPDLLERGAVHARHVAYVTAYRDRGGAAFKKNVDALAWDSYAWFVSERDGLVTIACRSAVWAQELDLLGPDLVARLNRALGEGGTAGPVRGLRTLVGGPRRR